MKKKTEFRFERGEDAGLIAFDVAASLERLGLVVTFTKENEDVIEFTAEVLERADA